MWVVTSAKQRSIKIGNEFRARTRKCPGAQPHGPATYETQVHPRVVSEQFRSARQSRPAGLDFEYNADAPVTIPSCGSFRSSTNRARRTGSTDYDYARGSQNERDPRATPRSVKGRISNAWIGRVVRRPWVNLGLEWHRCRNPR